MKSSRDYHGDVFYEVWRSGGNPDAVDYDRVEDCRWDYQEPEECAAGIMREEHNRRQKAQQAEWEQREQEQEQEDDRP